MKRYRIKRGVKSVEASSMEEASRIANSRRTHISDVSTNYLKSFLEKNGFDPTDWDRALVRTTCLRRYGSWYMVEQ